MELIYTLLFLLNKMSPYILFGFLVAGMMRAFVPQTTFARHLSATGLRAVVKAAMIGIPLPLCSCGVLPAVIAMRRNGASRAASTSFLISTPQTGIDSITATWSLLGPAFAILRPVAALLTALAGGAAVGRLETRQCCGTMAPDGADDRPRTFCGKCAAALRYGFVELVGSIGGWLMAGLLIAALITVYVPAGFFSLLGDNPLLSMLLAIVVAVPMYVCATGSIPIAMSLVMKGLSPGTAFVLLMAGPAANFASFTLIAREMGRKAAAVYLASIVAGSMVFGIAIDYVLPKQWFAIAAGEAAAARPDSLPVFECLCSALLVALLAAAVCRRYSDTPAPATPAAGVYTVKGLKCPHCKAVVTESIGKVKGVRSVSVDLSTRRATVEGDYSESDVIEAIRKSGFDVEE